MSTEHQHLPRDGVAQRFEDAYEAGFKATVRFLTSKGFAESDAEEFAQAAWVRGWERREQLRYWEKLLSWINSIAFNMARGNHRVRRRQTLLPEVLPVWEANVLVALEVQRMLRACHGKTRKFLELRYLHGWDANDIAKVYRCSTTAVRVRVCRGLKHLRTRGTCPHQQELLGAVA